MGWIADTFTVGGFASVRYMLEGVHPPEKWDPPTTQLSSASFNSISLWVLLAVIASLHLTVGRPLQPVLLMMRAYRHADGVAVPQGTALLLPGKQRRSAPAAILLPPMTDAMVANRSDTGEWQ
jgi:hypothetical protein